MSVMPVRRLAAVMLVLLPGLLLAHHSDAMYDLERLITIRGTLTAVSWSNPHVELHVQAANAAGERIDYVIEIAWPSALLRNGVTQDAFVTGDSVEIEGHPARVPGRIAAWGRSLVGGEGTVVLLPAKANFSALSID